MEWALGGEYYEHMIGNTSEKIIPNLSISDIIDKFFMDKNDPMIGSSRGRPGNREVSPRTLWNRLFSPALQSREIIVKQEASIKQEPLDNTQETSINTQAPEQITTALVVREVHTYEKIYNPQNRTRSPIPEPNAAERKSILRFLDSKGRRMGFFAITSVSPNADSCTIEYYQGIPNPISEKEKTILLKSLWELFPMFPANSNNTYDFYRLAGRIHHDLDQAKDLPDWPYKSNQRKNPGINPFYDPSKPQGYYQPWASDIADSLVNFRKNRGIGNIRPALDSESTIFLTTFLNAHPNFAPAIENPPH